MTNSCHSWAVERAARTELTLSFPFSAAAKLASLPHCSAEALLGGRSLSTWSCTSASECLCAAPLATRTLSDLNRLSPPTAKSGQFPSSSAQARCPSKHWCTDSYACGGIYPPTKRPARLCCLLSKPCYNSASCLSAAELSFAGRRSAPKTGAGPSYCSRCR